MSELQTLRRMLGFTPTSDGTDADEQLDEKLKYILESTAQRLSILCGEDPVPDQLTYIVIDVSCARFNRIGSEGMTSQSVKDASESYSDNDFAAYMTEIEAYKGTGKRGKVRFL